MKVSITGGREIEAALRQLGKQATARAVGRRGLRKAAEPIAVQAKALAPDDPLTGTNLFLKESIKVASRKSRDKDQVWVAIGIDASVDPARDVSRENGGGTYRDPGVAGVAVIQEFGAPARNVPAHPFMRPSWEMNKAATAQRITDEVRIDVEKTAQRAARKKARRK